MPRHTDAAMATRRRTTILLIEDSPSDTRLVKESLRDAPHERFSVLTAATLTTGLRKLERDNVDAILLDLSLPDSEGIDTFHAVKKRKPALPVVVLTTTDDDVLGLKMVHEGAQDYLPKTVLAQETCTAALTRAIRYAIERKRLDEQMEALNEQLQTSNEELAVLNQELTLDVKEGSAELQVSNEELRVSNEELRQEVEQRTAAERDVESRADRLAILNTIIHVLNEAPDLPTLYERTLITTIEQLGFERGLIATTNDWGQFDVQYAHNYPSEFVDELQHLDIDANPYTRTLYRQGKLVVMDEAQPNSVSFHHKGLQGAVVLIPFLSEGNVVGHLALHATTGRSFSPEDRALFQTIGWEFGTALAKLRAKKGLSESEARYRHLVKRNFDGVIIHSDGIIRFANDAAARIMKASSPDELIGMSALDIATPAYRELLAQRVQEIYRTRTPSTLAEVEITACDGTIVDIEMSGTLITYEGKPAVYIMARDISERKRMEAQLKQYADHLEDLVEERTAQLKDAERLAAIGQTATMIGHDLRNPLQALQFSLELEHKYCEVISDDLPGDPRVAKAAGLFTAMEQQIQYMDKIVSDLQDYARPLKVEREEIHLTPFITETLAFLAIPESISVNVHIPGSFTAWIDPHLMQRALSNLIMNAVQAMSEGGELTVTATKQNGAITITIHDTGQGVPDDIKDTLFSPLTTGKAKGTGLGLAVVKRIVEAHGGTVEFESGESGTAFVMTLPQHA